MKILVLEDNHERHKSFKKNFGWFNGERTDLQIVETAKEAIELFDKNKYDMAFLDHDLGNEVMVASEKPGTGYEVACWLEAHPDKQPKDIVIHSLNPDGAHRMGQALKKAVQMQCAWVYELDVIVRALNGDNEAFKVLTTPEIFR